MNYGHCMFFKDGIIYILYNLMVGVKNMSPQISVIIPIYNVGKYLHQCIESVIKQSYRDIEIILVNDGSQDNSPQICEEFAKNDNRVVVIHKENGGLSDARNTGIKIAKGEYIIFLDSDDYWEGNDSLEHIVYYIKDSRADVLSFGYNKYFEENKSVKIVSCIGDREYIIRSSKEKAFNYMVEKYLYISSSCCKIVKKDIIMKNNIFFIKGSTAEDIEWSARIAIAANKFDYYPRNLYIYRQREGSITKNIKLGNVNCLQDNITLCLNYAEQIKDTFFYESFMSYVSYQYITLLANSFKLSRTERKYILDKMVKHTYLLEYGTNKKVKMIRAIKRVFGFYGMYFLLHRYFISKKKLEIIKKIILKRLLY